MEKKIFIFLGMLILSALIPSFAGDTVNKSANSSTQLTLEVKTDKTEVKSDAAGAKIADQKFDGLEIIYLRPEPLSEQMVDEHLANIKKFGAKQVFLEAGYNNRVLNQSKIFPAFDKDKDWLKIYCEKAKKYDLKVNVWVKIAFWGHKKESIDEIPLLKEHPEWIDTNKESEILTENEGTYEEQNFVFVNLAVPGVQKAINDYISELLQYDISGISIDYIRFKATRDDPKYWFGYNKYSVEKFKKETGIDPLTIKEDLTSGSDFMKWIGYNEGIISNCVKEISGVIKQFNEEKNKKIVLSASPFTGYKSGKSPKFQNWKNWDDNGYIDLWLPMCMSLEMSGLEQEINGLKDMGLKAPYYPVVYPNKHGSLHPPMKDHYEVLKKCAIEKFCVFQYVQMKQEFDNNK